MTLISTLPLSCLTARLSISKPGYSIFADPQRVNVIASSFRGFSSSFHLSITTRSGLIGAGGACLTLAGVREAGRFMGKDR